MALPILMLLLGIAFKLPFPALVMTTISLAASFGPVLALANLSAAMDQTLAAGELGERLSGGERQRIGLARAFLHGAPLLLLDEPTSNLDSLNEGVILKALRAEAKESGRTVVLVSHRVSTTAVADRAYAME